MSFNTAYKRWFFCVDLRVYSDTFITNVWNNTFIIVPYTFMTYLFGWKLIILFSYIYKTVMWLNFNVNLTLYAKTESISLLALGERFMEGKGRGVSQSFKQLPKLFFHFGYFHQNFNHGKVKLIIFSLTVKFSDPINPSSLYLYTHLLIKCFIQCTCNCKVELIDLLEKIKEKLDSF